MSDRKIYKNNKCIYDYINNNYIKINFIILVYNIKYFHFLLHELVANNIKLLQYIKPMVAALMNKHTQKINCNI